MISVAIVDDERELCESIAAFVNGSSGFQCLNTYHSAKAALEHLPTEKPDVVLMDINMTGMNGVECVRRLKGLMPELKIMMLTVYEDSDQIFQALSAGASGYMLKRSTPAKLLEAIKELHEGGSPMSSSIARKVVASFQKSGQVREEKANLSPREQMVLESMAKGLTYKQTADQLEISIDTVRTHVRRIYEKLHVKSNTEAVAKYLRR
jgi:DNA-binding NarL/FixJ family response regulator